MGSIGEADRRGSFITAVLEWGGGGSSSEPSAAERRDAGESQHAVESVSRQVVRLPLVHLRATVWPTKPARACTTPQCSVEISTVGPVRPAGAAGALLKYSVTN